MASATIAPVEQRSDDPGDTRRYGLIAAWYGLGVMVLASVVGQINRNLIALVAEPIRLELGLSDSQIGMLNGLALTLVAFLALVPVGWLIDRVNRRWLFAACVVLWSGSTVAIGFAPSFPALFVAAMGVAVGEAILGPLVYSVIPDLFPRRLWVMANSVNIFATLIGVFGGAALGGTLLGWVGANAAALPALVADLSPWRSTLILSTCGAPILVVLILSIRLNRRDAYGTRAQEATSAGALLAYLRTHARALTGVFVGFGLSYAVFGATSMWSAVILQRTFGEAPARIGQISGTLGMIGAVAGVLTGLLVVRFARARYNDMAPMVVAQGALLIGVFVSAAAGLAQTAAQFYAIVTVKLFFTYMATSLSPTVLQMIAPARMRGRVMAIGGLIMYACQSLFPWLIGAVSDGYFTGPRGILQALTIVAVPAFAVGVAVLRWGTKTLPDTLRAVAASDAAPAPAR